MKINVETPLDDILPTENIRQSENVVLLGKLIESLTTDGSRRGSPLA